MSISPSIPPTPGEEADEMAVVASVAREPAPLLCRNGGAEEALVGAPVVVAADMVFVWDGA